MQTPSRFSHLASCILAVSLVAPASPRRSATPPAPFCESIQLAKDARGSKSLESDDRGAVDEGWSRSPAVRVRGRVKFYQNGYDAGRVSRFWRHYHGARQVEKTKHPKVQR